MNHLSVVELLLLFLEPDITVLLKLLRQILQHVLLHPAQNERGRHPLQPLQRRLILILHDGSLEIVPENIISVEIARQQIVKNAPELAESVLNGRARQSVSGTALHHLHRLGRGSGMVLDVLGLIDDLIAELLVFVIFYIALQQIIGGDNDIVLLVLLQLLPAFLLSPRYEFTRKLRCVAADLLSPVVHQRCRGHHKGCSPLSLKLCSEQHGQYLKGLSQTHVVCQNPPHPIFFQSAEPSVTVSLVSPHDLCKAGRLLEIRVVYRLEILHHLPKNRVPVAVDLLVFLQQLVQIQRPI